MNLKTIAAMLTIASLLSSCVSVSRKHFSEPLIQSDHLNTILYYASLAGNSHNTQPWRVEVTDHSIIRIYADTARKLHIVDPDSRGLYISLGAFIENLYLAAGSLGYEAQVNIKARTKNEPLAAEIKLIPSQPTNFPLSEIENRRTLRVPFQHTELKAQDIERLKGKFGDYVHFFSAGSNQGRYISKQTLAAYIQQANDEQAKQELAGWIRFSNKDVKQHRDGLTTSGMGINGIGGFMVRNLYKPEDSMKQSFVDTGVGKTKTQVENCGGWIIITLRENTPENWIRTGRIYQRMNIECRSMMIGYHPMNQMIEEPEFETEASNYLALPGVIQFVARVGYVDKYPEAVSVRRPVSEFVR